MTGAGWGWGVGGWGNRNSKDCFTATKTTTPKQYEKIVQSKKFTVIGYCLSKQLQS
jgi:hypothetical protein